MRIIAGELKGRIIRTPKSKLVRPTTDRVRESIFNFLNNIIDFRGIHVCDIYAGSGSLGLEALSRGAAYIDFVEKNYSIYNVLAENIKNLNVVKQCNIYKIDALKFTTLKEHIKYDLILADPPFFKYDIHSVVKNLISNAYLKTNGLLLIERSVQTEKEDTENFGTKYYKKIGDSLLYRLVN